MRSSLTAGIGTAVVVALLAVWRPAFLVELDHRVYDALTGAGGVPVSEGRTTIVAVDEASLGQFGQWPWPRHLLAGLIDRLDSLGAAAIGLDLLLAEPDRVSPDGDTALAEAFSRTPSVPAFALLFEGTAAAGGQACEVAPLNLVLRHPETSSTDLSLFDATAAICPVFALARAAGSAGFVNVAPDADGQLRRAPLVARYNGRFYPALALAVAGRVTSGQPIRLDQRADGSLTLTVGDRTVALDPHGRLLIRSTWRGESRPVLSAAAVLDGRAGDEQIRGRVVFVGGTAAGLRDTVAMPAEGAVPGVMAHAAMAETLLGGPGYERPEFADLIELGTALLASAVAGLIGAQMGWLPAVLATTALAAAAWWSAGAMLASASVWVSPLWALLGLAMTLVWQGLVRFDAERRRADRERDRRANAQRLIVQSLATITETRDMDTGRHARRTQAYTRLLATTLARTPAHRQELSPERIELIATLAPIHDIGKVGVSDAILRKPGTLTLEERTEMRRHPAIGHDSLLRAEALAGVHDDEVVALAKEIVFTHHERWDGSGYPRGLQGDAIPISGRLVALVDAYDALVVDRAYRNAMTHEEAVATIVEGKGSHFDPDVVDAFLSVHVRFRELQHEIGDD